MESHIKQCYLCIVMHYASDDHQILHKILRLKFKIYLFEDVNVSIYIYS